MLFVIAASDKEPITWANCNDIALDLTILSAGASGGIFANTALIQHLGDNTAIYGILVILCDFILVGFLVYIRRWRKLPVSALSGLRDLFMGLLTVGMTASVLYFGL